MQAVEDTRLQDTRHKGTTTIVSFVAQNFCFRIYCIHGGDIARPEHLVRGYRGDQTVSRTVAGVQTVEVSLSGPIPLAAPQLFVRVLAQ